MSGDGWGSRDALIATRATGVALADSALTQLLGVRLDNLEEDLAQWLISLNLLVRLARMLDVTIDKLITVDGADPELAISQPGDDGVVLALMPPTPASRPIGC